ncbi:hypothetical protein BDV29DRAFT_185083 [Aspergillus leporis]|uniref:Uncharacterized protein n=1 Tax=Aspergillus leporis TaxID=41062 RepID=A0A5N5WLN9_9EURO|nr:hypothetical protein BDV29DRAFT_185083 [Aspergillus leporis]
MNCEKFLFSITASHSLQAVAYMLLLLFGSCSKFGRIISSISRSNSRRCDMFAICFGERWLRCCRKQSDSRLEAHDGVIVLLTNSLCRSKDQILASDPRVEKCSATGCRSMDRG